jgi:murein L,D-transpeptidase YafK
MNPIVVRTVLAAALSFAAASASSAPAVWPPPLAPAAERVDEIRVDKSDRRMELLRRGKVVRRYRILLGDDPVGPKHRQGDERTPEGRYTITFRNGASRYHLSLRVSYPNAADAEWAKARGLDPGGDIMIHGGTPPGYNRDWTNGCIAVTNAEIEEIWRLVPVGTPITISP